GQLGYVSPPLLVGALLAARSLRARVARGPAAAHGPAGHADAAAASASADHADPAGRSLHDATNPADPAARSLHDATNYADPVDRWLHDATIVPALALGALCLWSRVAEPHWFAPAWLALPLAEARAPAVGRRLARAALATGLALSLFVHAWVLTDLAPRWLGRFYVPRYDLANDMLAWPRAMPALRNALARWRYDELSPPTVLTPHWTLGAQVFANVGPDGAVGTLGGPDDFRDWLPADAWHDRPWVLWVNDDRRPPARPAPLDAWTTLEHRAVVVERGGRPVRTVTIDVLGRPGAPPPPRPERPPP
ncbi:MAG TPA: hypothetical protein VFS00_21475, partial [Polyangiaceae bacterium]|nr:hypothetical protein [Polyangiaceae bacterium]